MIVDLNHNQNYKAVTKFIAFLQSLPGISDLQLEILLVIKKRIEANELIDTEKHWDIALEIFDTEIQEGQTARKGVYWRSWAVYIERDHFIVECKSRCEPDEFEHLQFEFCYYYWFDTKKEFYFPTEHNNIEMFLEDAKNYKQYITEFLNTIEIDVYVKN